jgi:hypothetical protein
MINRRHQENEALHRGGHQGTKLLRRKEMVPKKGFDMPSFGNSFSLNKIAIVIEYTGFANFSILSIRLTASRVSTESHDRGTPDPIACGKFWTPRLRFSQEEANAAGRINVGSAAISASKLPHQLASSCFPI